MSKEARRWKNNSSTSHLWAPLSTTCRAGDHIPAAPLSTAFPCCEGYIILSSRIEARVAVNAFRALGSLLLRLMWEKYIYTYICIYMPLLLSALGA